MPRRLRRSTGRPRSVPGKLCGLSHFGNRARRWPVAHWVYAALDRGPRSRGLALFARAIETVETWKLDVRVDEELLAFAIDPRVSVWARESPRACERLHDGDRRLRRAVGSPEPERALVDCEVERWLLPDGRLVVGVAPEHRAHAARPLQRRERPLGVGRGSLLLDERARASQAERVADRIASAEGG